MQRRKKLSIRVEFCVWEKNYDEIFITWRGAAVFGQKFLSWFWGGLHE
jgi:hypothetical protein